MARMPAWLHASSPAPRMALFLCMTFALAEDLLALSLSLRSKMRTQRRCFAFYRALTACISRGFFLDIVSGQPQRSIWRKWCERPWGLCSVQICSTDILSQSICFRAARMAILKCGICGRSRFVGALFCLFSPSLLVSRSLTPIFARVHFFLLHLIFFAHQNTISVSGVGDGITSMAVHPHLPILAIGSMGQVRHTCLFSSLRTFFNTAPAGCSHVFSYYRGTSPPDTVRFPPIYCIFCVPHHNCFVLSMHFRL